MKRRLLVFLTLILCFSLSAFAQKTITGVVLDGSANNEPMTGVAIVIKGTSIGTIQILKVSFQSLQKWRCLKTQFYWVYYQRGNGRWRCSSYGYIGTRCNVVG